MSIYHIGGKLEDCFNQEAPYIRTQTVYIPAQWLESDKPFPIYDKGIIPQVDAKELKEEEV